MKILIVCLLGLVSLSFAADREIERSHFLVPTGNGHGFQLFDVREGKLTGFLDHPYRYLRAPADLRKDGPERRNLLESFAFGDDRAVDASYLEETNVIHVTGERSDRYFFSPFGLEKNAMVALARFEGEDRLNAELKFHLGANPVSKVFWEAPLWVVKLPGERIAETEGAWVETGSGLGAMIYVPMGAATAECVGAAAGCAQEDLSLRLQLAPVRDGGWGWSGVVIAYVENPGEIASTIREIKSWLGARAPRQVLDDALSEWRDWRVEPAVGFVNEGERKLWRQSEAVLRMGQVREPNIAGLRSSHGMILASLAPGHWTTGWVRDGVYATVALARMGHLEEARKSLEFFLNAEPVGKFKEYLDGKDYLISVTRYYGSGEEEADYSDQATPNVETDGWGLVLWAARQYLDASGDLSWLSRPTRTGSVYEALLNGIARPIEGELEERPRIMKPDSSIWEVHEENKRHFAFTTIAAARGLCDFASIASRAGRAAEASKFAGLSAEIRRDFPLAFRAPEGHLLGAIERSVDTDLDGALIEAFTLDVLDPRSEVARRTLENLHQLELPTGGFSRTAGTSEYQTDEWAFINYRVANAYRRVGEAAKADRLLEHMRVRAERNFHLLPEHYGSSVREGNVGTYRGSNPMVGYGPGAFVISLLEREGHFERRDCGRSN